MAVNVANHQGQFIAANLVDGDPSTAWVGGGKGIGPGKWIEFDFLEPVALEYLTIHNGHQGKGQFKKFRRISKGVILYPDETRQIFTLADKPGAQKVVLEPKAVRTLKIIITGVVPSSKDKSIGKAKVAVSEIVIYGEVSALEGEAADPAAEEKAPAAPAPEPEKEAPKPVKKAEPKSAPEPAVEKAEPPKPAPVKVEKKPVPEAEAPKPAAEAKPAPKSEPAPKPKAKAKPKSKPKPKPASEKNVSATAAHLPEAQVVPAGTELPYGSLSPWLNLEFVAMVKRYYALLTTLHDSYPDIFTSDVRERERADFIKLQDAMRAKKMFGKHHIAMVDAMGLSFDEPKEQGGTTSVRVHGPYRYYMGDTAYEFAVDSVFSFRQEGGKWLIRTVAPK